MDIWIYSNLKKWIFIHQNLDKILDLILKSYFYCLFQCVVNCRINLRLWRNQLWRWRCRCVIMMKIELKMWSRGWNQGKSKAWFVFVKWNHCQWEACFAIELMESGSVRGLVCDWEDGIRVSQRLDLWLWRWNHGQWEAWFVIEKMESG